MNFGNRTQAARVRERNAQQDNIEIPITEGFRCFAQPPGMQNFEWSRTFFVQHLPDRAGLFRVFLDQ